MTIWLSIGLLFTLSAIVFVLVRWWNVVCIGVTPVKTLSFIAILFTSGLDVGLIMFPLTEFPEYSDIVKNPEYAFSNPLALEFGFWGFLVWSLYFLTCFYFCVIEPEVRFFEIYLVKLINNIIIVGTCAFTANLFLTNLPWYMPQLGEGQTANLFFYALVALVISAAVYSSSSLRYLRALSLGSAGLFFLLIIFMWAMLVLGDYGGLLAYLKTLALVGDYFAQINQFVLPINDYHEFYLYWWFAWSIMIGQFTARFVGGLRTWQLLLAMLVCPSILIAVWFAVLYSFYLHGIDTHGVIAAFMIVVGIAFVINSLDSLIRLYTDNLSIGVQRFGLWKYFAGNMLALFTLTLLFQLEFLKIQWIGALVVGLFFGCFVYICLYRRQQVWGITGSPATNTLDYGKFLMAD
ncbi:MAG: BCCT family transporter [Pseudomonadota bacterium]